ncbi:MAG: T9SS type A sorting domain-containing protein [Ferruginibacter sp.]
MKKMVTRFFCLSVLSLLAFAKANAQTFPTIYATVSSGDWAKTTDLSPAATIWETFPGNATNTPGAQGTGTAYTGPAAAGSQVNGPSGTHVVYIRAGHTVSMNAAGRSFHDLIIEAGGKLWSNGAADLRLQVVNGGTGFAYPQSGVIVNNGTLGGPGDGMFLETGTACQSVSISGTGTTFVKRLRMPGGKGPALGGVVSTVIDQNLSFAYDGAYALSAFYSTSSSLPAATDNYSLTINAGRTVTLADDSTAFHTNSLGSATAAGTYTYNINGTLDLSQNLQTGATLTAISPTLGTINLNINGKIITGAAFNSFPVAPGVAHINVANGAVVDATLAKVMRFTNSSFQMNGNAALLRTVPAVAGTRIEFPVGVGGSYNPLIISGESGPAEVYTVGLTNVPVVAPPPLTLPRAWGIAEAVPGGNVDTLRFGFTTADIGASGFDPAAAVYVAGWDPINSKWVTVPATMAGTGTVEDPYFARVVGTFVSTAYVLTNTDIPTPVHFVDVNVAKVGAGLQVSFGNAIELDVKDYVIEKSTDGIHFVAITTLQPKTNNGLLNSYSFTDAAPYNGNNYYRVKATEKNGNVKFSAVLSISTIAKTAGVSVIPNPVKDKAVNIQLAGISKAVYTISIFNTVGQKVYTKQINHDGNITSLIANLPSASSKGIYRLQVNSSVSRYTKNIIVE